MDSSLRPHRLRPGDRRDDRRSPACRAERQHQVAETAPRAGADIEHAALAGVPPPPKPRRGALAIGDIGLIACEQADRLAGHAPAKRQPHERPPAAAAPPVAPVTVTSPPRLSRHPPQEPMAPHGSSPRMMLEKTVSAMARR